jgi:hypothetical protein
MYPKSASTRVHAPCYMNVTYDQLEPWAVFEIYQWLIARTLAE